MGLFDSIKKAFSGFSMAGNARFYHDALGLLPDEDFKTISTGLVGVNPSAVDHGLEGQ